MLQDRGGLGVSNSMGSSVTIDVPGNPVNNNRKLIMKRQCDARGRQQWCEQKLCSCVSNVAVFHRQKMSVINLSPG
jgi:hypothetical protein